MKFLKKIISFIIPATIGFFSGVILGTLAFSVWMGLLRPLLVYIFEGAQ